ncbi:hypothetical protein IWQ62_005791, partial [Dispira parvispora]
MGKKGGNRKKNKGSQPKKSTPSTPNKAKATAPVVAAAAAPAVVPEVPVDSDVTPLSTGPSGTRADAVKEAPVSAADTSKLAEEPVPVTKSQPQVTKEKPVADTLPEH